MSDHNDPDYTDDDIILPTTPVAEVAQEEPEASDEDVLVPNDEQAEDDVAAEIVFPDNQIDLRGETQAHLNQIGEARLNDLGAKQFAEKVRQTGSWENILFRAMDNHMIEEDRIQDALAALSAEDRAGMSSRYTEDGKTLLRTSKIGAHKPAKGEVKTVSGTDALIAFESISSGSDGKARGGGYRIPLYNSGITIDVMTPTGNDLQTMLNNCILLDTQLGAAHGAHYFVHHDHIYKEQIIRFLRPLIVDTSYVDWRKGNKLWSLIKLPDLQGLVMTIAAICWRNGFDGFITKCTRKPDQDHPNQCTHTETISINLFEMIVTRFRAMSKTAIDFMVEARNGGKKHTVNQIAQYQAGLGLEGETIKAGNLTFTMRIPTIEEHLEAGSKFLGDITNELQGDNNDGRYDQMGFRYIRTFLPWVASVEVETADGGVLKTTDPDIIVRQLEITNGDGKVDEFYDALVAYVNKAQLTYVGHPIVPCAACGYVAETPSGMRTIDPFSAFFTMAFLYLSK